MNYSVIAATKDSKAVFINASQLVLRNMANISATSNYRLKDIVVTDITRGSVVIAVKASLQVNASLLPLNLSQLFSEVITTTFNDTEILMKQILEQAKRLTQDVSVAIPFDLAQERAESFAMPLVILEDRSQCKDTCQNTSICTRIDANAYACTCPDGRPSGNCTTNDVTTDSTRPAVTRKETNLNVLEIGLIAGGCGFAVVAAFLTVVLCKCLHRKKADIEKEPGPPPSGGGGGANGIRPLANGAYGGRPSVQEQLELREQANGIPASRRASGERLTVHRESEIYTGVYRPRNSYQQMNEPAQNGAQTQLKRTSYPFISDATQ